MEMTDLHRQALDLAPGLVALRRELHQYPELSHEESETASRVARELDRLGIPYRAGVGGHGVVADVEGSLPGPTIALRADMDALPIQEETEIDFPSSRPGIMHACGHDAHTAMLIGAAELLSRGKEQLHGTVRLIFQPAEEVNAGASAMIEEGVLEGVSEIYGLHNLPTLPAGMAATRYGALMGSVDRIEITLEGKGGHGAIPDQSVDPIVCASAIIQSLQSIISREVSPFDPVVVTIGSIHAGEANNVIPHYCRMTGTVRTFHPDVQEKLPERLERIVQRIADGYRCKAKLDYISQTPVLMNHDDPVKVIESVIDETLGSEYRVIAKPTLAGEDFSIYLKHVPGCFFWLGSGPKERAEEAFGLHHPKYWLNEDCLPYGASLLAHIAKFRLTQLSGGHA
ncbi:amidohydrolase [Paenibacillus sp. 1011MAR3C5]|nr:amidohydrolase [Paenibacillus sp. 1011MAR3C5]